MATEEKLDDIDIKILKLLQQNSRLTVKELAARVHLSPSPTFERQKRLEREGYIQRYGAIVDHHKMGHNVIVLCNIRLKQHTHDLIQQFMDTVQNIDQITECYNTTGDYDFQIKVYAHDMKDYQDFMLNTLGNIDCIGSLHSIIVIGEIKDSHYIPASRLLAKPLLLLCIMLSSLFCMPLKAQNPGEIVTEQSFSKKGEKHYFYAVPIPDNIFSMMKGKTYKKNCTVPRSELRYLRCLHTDKEGRSIVGEMVVNKAIANDVLDILYKLYRAKYPIERMRLIDYWNADDERAMRANNSSCFNFRFISHTHTVSKHGRGMAVDINTLYNPYHKRLRNGKEVIEPATARPYLDRSKKHAYMIQRGDLCYRLFKEKGFRWGGDWKHSKDYQHFEK